MAIRLTTTKEEGAQHGVKTLVYGMPGVGKTVLCSTAPNPVIISNEAGLLSLRNVDIPVIAVKTLHDLAEAYRFITESDDAKGFETVCLDSLSEIAESVLSYEKGIAKDPRQAYGELQVKTLQLCREFRDLPNKHVYFSSKQERTKNDQNVYINQPSLPGTKLPQEVPYLFDEVMCLRTFEDEDGTIHRKLQTQPSFDYVAKDRSGGLEVFEDPDLGAIIQKIIGA